MPKPTTPEIDQLQQLRDHHLAEAKRCDDAILMLRNVGDLMKRAGRIAGKAHARAAAAPLPRPKPAKAKPARRAQVTAKARRADPRPEYRISSSARSAQRAKTGSRPTDIIRRQFAAAGDNSLTKNDLLIALQQANQPVPHRVVGVVLRQMADRREVKSFADGSYVAWKLLPPAGAEVASDAAAVANSNGAHG